MFGKSSPDEDSMAPQGRRANGESEISVDRILWHFSQVPKGAVTALGQAIHMANRKWWVDIHTGQPIQRNKGEMLALIHSEVSEALEGVRKDSMDDKLPSRKMEEVELADAIIRILDYGAGHDLDIEGAIMEKCRYNLTRKDHSLEHRREAGGKKF